MFFLRIVSYGNLVSQCPCIALLIRNAHASCYSKSMKKLKHLYVETKMLFMLGNLLFGTLFSYCFLVCASSQSLVLDINAACIKMKFQENSCAKYIKLDIPAPLKIGKIQKKYLNASCVSLSRFVFRSISRFTRRNDF